MYVWVFGNGRLYMCYLGIIFVYFSLYTVLLLAYEPHISPPGYIHTHPPYKEYICMGIRWKILSSKWNHQENRFFAHSVCTTTHHVVPYQAYRLVFYLCCVAIVIFHTKSTDIFINMTMLCCERFSNWKEIEISPSFSISFTLCLSLSFTLCLSISLARFIRAFPNDVFKKTTFAYIDEDILTELLYGK